MRASFLLTLGLTAAVVGFTGCEPETESAPAPSAGSADFSRVVAIGDDYLAGVTNGGLSRQGQEYSVANLLAKQMQLAGGGAFSQPLLQPTETTGGLALLGLTDRNEALTGPVAPTFTASETFGAGTACAVTRYRFPIWEGAAAGTIPQNLALPGLTLADALAPGLGDEANLSDQARPYNAYLERILSDGADSRSYVSLVKDARPTFIILNIGLSDVLPFVLSGGTCNALPTNNNVLGGRAAQLFDSLRATNPNARGIIIGLPRISNLPLTRTRVSDLNRRLGRPNTAPMYVVNDAGATVEIASNDIILLPMTGRVGRLETATGAPANAPFGLDNSNPLRAQDVLADGQLTTANSRITARGGINETLEARADSSRGRFAYTDIDASVLDLVTGRYIDGVRYSGDPITGGLFSLDGYSLSPRGNGLIVNYIISVLNNAEQGFNARIPQIDINSLPATVVP